MNIQAVSLKNFCCFGSRRIDLTERFNLLIGDNGSGKSSILDGIAVGLGSLFLGLPESTVARHIHQDEIRFRSFLQGDTYTQEKQFPVVVTCEGIVDGHAGQWSRELSSLDGRTTRQNAGWIEEIGQQLDAHVRAGQTATLPIVSYYGTGRLWVQKRQKAVDPLVPGSRFLGYLDCLDPASDEKRLLAWFKIKELQSIQEKKKIGVLEAVRKAILRCISDANHVYYHISQNELLLRFPDREMPFTYLSDGYRNMLAMVADIAVRCATLNPALKGDAITKTPGMVLIDEIDLHLHPKWQRHVVEDLLNAFPKIQFVATTHSPFIIQSLVPVDGVQLVNLDNAEANDFADKSVEDIAEQLQGAGEQTRSDRYKAMMSAAEAYYRALEQTKETPPEQLQYLKDCLDELASRFSDDPAYHAILKIERESRLRNNRDHHAPN